MEILDKSLKTEVITAASQRYLYVDENGTVRVTANAYPSPKDASEHLYDGCELLMPVPAVA